MSTASFSRAGFMRPARMILRVATAAAVALAVVPVTARAGVTCVAFRDRAGDARVIPGPISSIDRVDIVGGGLVTTSDGFRFELALQSLAVPPTRDEIDTYVVQWRVHDVAFEIEAKATRDGWSFARSITTGSDTVRAAIAGGVDTRRNVVAFAIPYSRELYPGALLASMTADTSDGRLVETSRATAEVPGTHRDFAAGPDLIAGPGCSRSLDASGERCGLASDPASDTELTPVATGDRSIDLRSMRAGANDLALVFELGVVAIEPIPESVDAQAWTVSWKVGSEAFSATAIRDREGTRFTWTAPDDASDEAVGVIDSREGTVTIAVSRAAFPLRRGTQITSITAHAADLAQGTVEVATDNAPNDAQTAPSYVTAVPCAKQKLQVCPVVSDAPGDAGPIRGVDGQALPENQESLDVVAAGADTRRDSVIVSMRVTDLGDAPPAGYETLGYTISWSRHDGRRFYAQAYRTDDVWTYAYGIDATDDDGPSGATFGGVRTDGSADMARNVIRIAVPRSLLGNSLPRYGATSWVLVPGNTVATYQLVDSTVMGAYRLGVTCEA